MDGAAILDHHDAVLFDMDGTLVDTEELWFQTGQSVAQRFGAVLPPEAADLLHGLDVPAFIARLTRDFGLEASPAEFEDALSTEVLRRLQYASSRPGATELVHSAAASGKAVALVSNSSHQVIGATLAGHDWARLLRRRFSVDEVAAGKPQPDLYLHAAAALGVDTQRCVVLEDSVAGVTSAVRAGATCIAVSFGQAPERFAGLTELVVPSLAAAGALLFG